MKSFAWILLLLVIGIGLVIYNFKYLPLQDEYFKITNENLMWQAQVKELENKLNETSGNLIPIFSQTYLWNDLFESTNSLDLTEPAKSMLKEIVTKLQETSGDIIIAGHSDNQPVADELKYKYPTDRQFSFAKAIAVASYLQSWGINNQRLVCIGYGATRPVDTSDTPEARSKNRRIEIIVKQSSPVISNPVDTIAK
jgi:flagellar motor protein MotB